MKTLVTVDDLHNHIVSQFKAGITWMGTVSSSVDLRPVVRNKVIAGLTVGTEGGRFAESHTYSCLTLYTIVLVHHANNPAHLFLQLAGSDFKD